MGILERFFKQKHPAPPATWKVQFEVLHHKTRLRVGTWVENTETGDRRTLSLPLRPESLPENTQPITPDTLLKFERVTDLLRQKIAISEGRGVVYVPVDRIGEVDAEDRGILGLAWERGWKVNVAVTDAFGHGKGRIALRWTDPQGEHLGEHPAHLQSVSCGFWDPTQERLLFFPPEVLALRKAVSATPQQPDTAEEALYMAGVQAALAAARKTAVRRHVFVDRIDAQIERETWLAPDRVQVHVKALEGGGLELQPRMSGVEDEEMARRILDAPQQPLHTQVTGADRRGRVRVALRPKVRDAVQSIRRNRHIPAERRQEFERNPRAYLQPPDTLAGEPEVDEPEDLWDEEATLDLRSLEHQLTELDVGDFGDRVIGIGPLERAQPEPIQPRLEGSWFEGDGGDAEASVIEALQSLRDAREEEGTDEVEPAEGETVLLTADNVEELQFDQRQHLKLQQQAQDLEPPTNLRATLMPHQREGYAWLRFLNDQGSGGLLADDMGLGKTVQVIALLAWLHQRGELGPALVVAPKSVIANWAKELRRFCPDILDVYTHTGSDRILGKRHFERQDIVLTTYDTLRRNQIIFGQVRFSVMVCDEAQAIKNYTTLRAAACRAMNTGIRLALTATPVENRLEDLWSILDFCQPGLVGSMRNFHQEWVEPIDNAVSEKSATLAGERLRKQLGEHYIRRTKEDHLRDLPPKRIHHVDIAFSKFQEQRYRAVLKWLRDGAWNPGEALQALRYLLDICVHPLAFQHPGVDQDHDPLIQALGQPASLTADSPKLQYTVDCLKNIQARGERALVFVHSRRVQKIMQVLIRHTFNLHADVINGETEANARQSLVDDFNHSPGFNVLLVSPLAAGVGLNITGANHVIHLMRMWNPARENQATDRVYRIGQNLPVHVYVPIVRHPDFVSAEARLHELLESKRHLAERVIQPRESQNITRREIEDLIHADI